MTRTELRFREAEQFAILTKQLEKAVKHLRDKKLSGDEATIKSLLGRWVSELEPTIAYDSAYNILGLSGPSGQVVVETMPEEVFFRWPTDLKTDVRR